MSKIIPFSNRVVVTREGPKEYAGSIVIPEMAKKKEARGVVRAVGLGLYNENGFLVPVQAQVGDHVLFGTLAGSEVTVDGEEFLIIRDTDILGKIEDSPKSTFGPFNEVELDHEHSDDVNKARGNAP